MPLENGQGYSQYTATKQEHFRGLLRLHLNAARGIMSRYGGKYLYFDINAGCGCVNGHQGSPVIFAEEVAKQAIEYEAFMLEREPDNALALSERLMSDTRCHIITGDHHQTLMTLRPGWSRDYHGLLYCDPNGIPPFELLGDFSRIRAYRKIDILIYLSANNVKRVSQVFHRNRLRESIGLIDKKIWLVRAKQGREQWTLLLGSNWLHFPQWERKGFYRLDSERGQAIFAELNHTKTELKEMTQYGLF